MPAPTQLLQFKQATALPTSGTNYGVMLYGRSERAWSATETIRGLRSLIPTDGAVAKFNVHVDVAPGSGKSWAFTAMLNGSATALTATISDTNTDASDLAHTLALAAGDTVSMKVVATGTPASGSAVSWTFEWTPTIDGEYIYGGDAGPSNSTAGYYMWGHYASLAGAFEYLMQAVMPCPGTWKKLYGCHYASGSTDHLIITARKNAADQTLVADVTGTPAGDKIVGDVTHSFTCAAGDLISMKLGEPGTWNYPSYWAAVFVPDDTSTFPVLGCPQSQALAYTYISFGGYLFPTATESIVAMLGMAGYSVMAIQVKLFTAPGAGHSRTFVLRKDGADTALTMTISNTDTTGSATGSIDLTDLCMLDTSHSSAGATGAYASISYLIKLPSTNAYNDSTSFGGIIFSGEVIEIPSLNHSDGVSIGGITISGGAAGTPENHLNDGIALGGITISGSGGELWSSTPNNLVAVKGGVYRINGTTYTLDALMSYPGLGTIAALEDCGSAPTTIGLFRYDLLSVDASQVITITAGAEASTPVMPVTPANEVKLDHVLRYYGQTSITQADIGKLYKAPALSSVTATASDSDLAWAETTSTITVSCYDQYGQIYSGGTIINSSIVSGNGSISPASVSIGYGGTGTFTYTRGSADPGDISPILQFASAAGPMAVVSILLRNAGGDVMV